MTRVHAADGSLLAEYSRERRLYLPSSAIPDLVKQAFISAEDKNFYSHRGFDPEGILRAAVVFMEGHRHIQGASTITQQVAKNFLSSSDRTVERKIREMLLSLRIESAYSKDKILELYLNEIYLGLGNYGVAAAALNYFNKSVHELTVAEVAYLAALPKEPSALNPFRDHDRAIERRNYVIGRMEEDGYITHAQAKEARAEPLDRASARSDPRLDRRRLLRRGGAARIARSLRREEALRGRPFRPHHARPENAADGAQGARRRARALRRGAWLARRRQIDRPRPGLGRRARRDPGIRRHQTLASRRRARRDRYFHPRRPAARARSSGDLVAGRQTGTVNFAGNQFPYRTLQADREARRRRLCRAARRQAGEYRLRQIPEVSGACVAMDPFTGRVLAMVGGFSFDQSEFNRATQALRQPGSSFKPFVYAAALDNGYTPSSIVLDEPITIDQGNGETWTPENFEGKSGGPHTLRYGVEHSINQMTVRLARDIGMPLVTEYAKKFGIYDNLPPYLVDVARRRRDDRPAHGDRLFDVRQRRHADQGDADRPHPGSLGQHDLPPRRAHLRRLRRREMGQPGRAEADRQAQGPATSSPTR